MKTIYKALMIAVILAGAYIFGAFWASISCSAPQSGKIPLTVIMYHNITKKPSLRGKYCVYINEFEDDLKYLSQNGYSPISVKQLCDYAYNGTPLPDKPVIITFDDGFESFAEYACPLLEKYKFKAVVNVVGSYAERYTRLDAEQNPDCHNLDYSYLNLDSLKRLAACGYAEIGCHTYDMHRLKTNRRGCGKNKGESPEAYETALSCDIQKFNAVLADTVKTDIFAYPYGIYSAETPDILRKNGFCAVFDCTEKINYIDRGNIDWLFNIHRFNRPSGITSECFFAKMQ